jgi:hypothetical protein
MNITVCSSENFEEGITVSLGNYEIYSYDYKSRKIGTKQIGLEVLLKTCVQKGLRSNLSCVTSCPFSQFSSVSPD